MQRWKAAGGSGDAAIDQALVLGTPTLGGASSYGGTFGGKQRFQYSDDGKYAGYVTCQAGSDNKYVRIVNVSAQTAIWTFQYAGGNFPAGATMLGIDVPGQLGLVQRSGSDQRRVKLYYSLDGGVTPVEFQQGDQLAAIAIGGKQVTLKVVMQHPTTLVDTTSPSIGDSAGNGPWLLYDDGYGSGGHGVASHMARGLG